MSFGNKGAVQQASVSAIVTRADGTVEDLGIVAYWHKSFVKRLVWRVKHKLGV